MYNLLLDALIRVVRHNGTEEALTLPGVLAASVRGEIATFPALRAHQRHAWHACPSQLAVLALLAASRVEPWEDEAGWRDGLRGLTPGHPDDAPWCLVSPADRPAFLQPPVPGGIAELRNCVDTPDALDMLVTSRNHDLKVAAMARAAPEDWLFALVTLQTMEGFLGAGNYGISRMNGGFANRAALGVAPPGGPGKHLRRDVEQLLAHRGGGYAAKIYAPHDGHALLWLLPWDGSASLQPQALDEYYIEICRRVRLVEAGGCLAARTGGSKAPRVTATPGGLTGDPWAPLVADKDSAKVLTVNAGGFDYRRMTALMFTDTAHKSALQVPTPADAPEGLELVARALARGQGKTEGYHERRVPIPRMMHRFGGWQPTDPAAYAAGRRIDLAAAMKGVLRYALMVLFQGGPDKIDPVDKDAARKAEPFLRRFEEQVDRGFFDALWLEMEAEAPDAVRGAWVRRLLDDAAALLDQADQAAPKATWHRFRARVNARFALRGRARCHVDLGGYLAEETSADA